MFKVISREFPSTEPYTHLPITGDETYVAGETIKLVSGAATKAATTSMPTHITIAPLTANHPLGMLPVYEIQPDLLIQAEVVLIGDNSGGTLTLAETIKPGMKLQINADGTGLTNIIGLVSGPVLNGVFTVIDILEQTPFVAEDAYGEGDPPADIPGHAIVRGHFK